jgi:hypothetical protein
MATKINSIPPKRLAETITASAGTFKLTDIEGFDGVNLSSSIVGDVMYGSFQDPTGTIVEFVKIDPTTIASASITLLKRGLSFNEDGTETEVPANKLLWIKQQTIVNLGTDTPQILAQFVAKTGDQTVGGVKTFSSSPIVPTPTTDYQASTKKYGDDTFVPKSYLDTDITLAANSDTKVATQKAVKAYVDDTAFAGAPDASETVKGISEEATLAQTIAGDSTGETGAKLFITPEKLIDAIPTIIPKVYPDTIFSNMTGSSNELVRQQYTDATQFALASMSTTTIYYVNSLVANGHQIRNTTSDWASATFISSKVTLGAYLYLLLRDASNNYRVYRYSVGNLAAGGTLMTISGQAFATTGGAEMIMTSNGTNFYFNYKAGNNASDRIISKYTISGTTLTYVSDITCGASSNVANQIIRVDSSENIYGWYRSTDFGGDNKVRKYNSSGTLQTTSEAYGSSQIWRAVYTFGTASYINYTVTSNPWWYLIKIYL